MCNELIFTITFTVVLFFSLIISIKKGLDGMIIISASSLIIGGLILWMPFGLTYSVSDKTEPIKCQVVKTSRVALVDDGSKIWEFSDYKNYQLLNDSTRFFIKKRYNMYGGVCGTELLIY